MELFFFCDALRRQEAKKVIGVIPYFGYARQDIQHRSGECVSVNVIIRFLESIGFSKIYTVNLHDEATEGVFSIPFKNIDAFPLLADEIKKYVKTNDPSKVAIVSPDQGGVERSRRFGIQFFNGADFSLCMIEKKRSLEQIHQSKAMDLYGDVKGKTIIIADDMTTSGGTLINAANLCRERGATRVIAAVVHHDFGLDAPKKIQDSSIEKFFTTDTIALQENQKIEKLVEVSVSNIISEEIKHLL
jgi:ribose-phosphate pyrophosphokinase